MTDPSLYDTDIVAWADRQVAELRRLAENGVSRRLTGATRAGLDLDELWREAVARAAAELRLYGRSLPADVPGECPFERREILHREVDVGALVARLRAARSGP